MDLYEREFLFGVRRLEWLGRNVRLARSGCRCHFQLHDHVYWERRISLRHRDRDRLERPYSEHFSRRHEHFDQQHT